MRRIASIALVFVAAGCGGLGTPDLGTGVVVGKITGGTSAGSVYPLGRPDLKVALAADGSFRLTAPAGTQALVLYDGTFQTDATGAVASFGRAELVDVDVPGADVRDLGERSAAAMPEAGGLLAGARAESGARCRSPRFIVEGTDRDAVASSGAPAAFLAPLPAGSYSLAVAMDGFRAASVQVTVVSAATMPYESELMVDDGAAVKGCEATEGCDSDELLCESDGRCHYGGGGPSPTCGATCDPSATTPCAAGLACQNQVCTAPQGCAAYLAVAGSSCVADDACRGALAGGSCRKSDDHSAGICSAPCQMDSQCAAFGTGATCSSNLCRLAH